jgi:hypothetical protein
MLLLLLLLLHGGREICQRITVNNWHLTKILRCSSREAQKEYRFQQNNE